MILRADQARQIVKEVGGNEYMAKVMASIKKQALKGKRSSTIWSCPSDDVIVELMALGYDVVRVDEHVGCYNVKW